HAIRTRLTKESEEARTAIDDEKDEMEERKEGESRTQELGYRREKELVETEIQRWEDFRDSSDDGESTHDRSFDESRSHPSSPSVTYSSSSYNSDFEPGSRSPQEPESRSSSECSGGDGSDWFSDSDDEAPSDNGSNDAIATQVEESVIGKTLSDAGFNTIRSEKRKRYGTSSSDMSESDGSTGGLRLNVAPTRQEAKGKSVLGRTQHTHRAKKRMRAGPSDDINDSDGDQDSDYGLVSVKRKASEDIEVLRLTKKMREDDETSDD
ncbi:hypothetical protein BGZ74_003770, partial [Mortierella antarctica]